MMPVEWCDITTSPPSPIGWLRIPHLWIGLSLPLLLKYRDRFPLAKLVRPDVSLLLQCLLVSIGMFFVAHLLIFRLHLPNRYSEHSFRILAALAAGMAIVILWDKLVQLCLNWGRLQGGGRSLLALSLTAILGSYLIVYPHTFRIDHARFPVTGYVRGKFPELYQFFAQQPKDIVIASLTPEVNKLPSFTQRSILTGGEGYLLPYHKGYYQKLSQRTIDLMQAQYSRDLTQVQAFIQKYSVDFWLIEETSFQPKYLERIELSNQFPTEALAIQQQIRQARPALAKLGDRCSVLKIKRLTVLDAKCLLSQ